MTVIIVTGGRDFTDEDYVNQSLDYVHQRFNITRLIQGGAKGVDTLAQRWAEKNNIEVQTFSADWDTHGKAAGVLRNLDMLTQGNPDYVVSFPGGNGTAHMVKSAIKARVKVLGFLRQRVTPEEMEFSGEHFEYPFTQRVKMSPKAKAYPPMFKGRSTPLKEAN